MRTHEELVASGLHECASDCPPSLVQNAYQAGIRNAEALRRLSGIEPTPPGSLTITKDELLVALVESGLSYQQPPEQDTQRVWDLLESNR